MDRNYLPRFFGSRCLIHHFRYVRQGRTSTTEGYDGNQQKEGEVRPGSFHGLVHFRFSNSFGEIRSEIKGGIQYPYGPTPSALHLPGNEHCIGSPKSKRIGHHRIHLHPSTAHIRHIVEVALRVRLVQVNRWGKGLIFYRKQ